MNDSQLPPPQVGILASTTYFRRAFQHGENATIDTKMNQLATEERCITLIEYLFVDLAKQGKMDDLMLRRNTGYLLGFLSRLGLEPYGSRIY